MRWPLVSSDLTRAYPIRRAADATGVRSRDDLQPCCLVTLGAIWLNDEQPESPRLWMATDSRISDEVGSLIDEGIKLYEVPVVCRSPGPSGFFDTPFFTTSVGVVGAGGTLVYQQVCGTLVPILGNLTSTGRAVPSIGDIASFAGGVATHYVRSLGARRPNDAAKVTLVVGGESADGGLQAYRLSPDTADGGLLTFAVEPLDLQPRAVHFIGDKTEDARTRLQEVVAKDEPGASKYRAALNVIREFINDPDRVSIGGDVQIGFTTGRGFRRVASFVPDNANALRLLNSIDLDSLPAVGPCDIGIEGMVSP